MAADSSSSARTGWGSLRDLTGYQWFVFVVCCLAWDMDCMDQQLFVLARRPAMTELVPPVSDTDPRLNELSAAALRAADVGRAASNATALFMIGWAVGGIGFGIMGDRVGRVKTLMLTILMYALFTGLSSLSRSTTDFFLYRFLTGLGVGGVFAAAVTLLAETMPDRARPFILGMFQASSVLGNCTAALLSMWFGANRDVIASYSLGGHPLSPWRLMFLVGIVPALLVVVIQARLREPERWKSQVEAGRKAGSYAELLGNPRWRWHACFGLLLALSGVIGLWGIAFFSPDLQQIVAEPTYEREAAAAGMTDRADIKPYVEGRKAYWGGITSLVQNFGSFFGIFAFSWVTAYVGRKPAFAVFLTCAGASTAFFFLKLNSFDDILWMAPLMGFFQLAIFGGYAIYFPELFPTRLRSTGTSFCYNVGRLISATGPFLLGLLLSTVYAGYPSPEPLRYAGVTMCLVFLLGLIALPFLPETRDKPLPD